jgi:hypothetical protein
MQYRNCIYRASVLTGRAEKECRQMPIAVRNELPTLNSSLGSIETEQATVKLNVLFDTCGAIITGFKPYHDRIRRLHPEVVYDYESSGDMSNPFHPIKLSGDIRDPKDITKDVVGDLTAVIRYKTPYIDVEGHPILLCFALGDTVSCNSILGLPAINMLEMIWNIRQGTVTAVGIQSPNVFAVVMKEVEYGLPKPDRKPPVHATRPNLPPPAENVSQFHCLAKNHQAPFGGAHGHLRRNKSVAFDVFPRPA